MKLTRIFAVATLVAILPTALAQSDTVTATGTAPAPAVTVTLMTSAATPGDLGTTYAIGQLNNSTFTYGPDFLIKLSYSNVTSSVALAISGSQTNYALAYKHTPKTGTAAATTSDVAFGTIGTVTVGGAATDTYAKGTDTTAFDGFSTASADATVFAIGAKSTTAASTDLSTTITITATVN